MWYDVIGVIYRLIIIFLINKNKQWCHPEIDTPGFHCRYSSGMIYYPHE